MGVANVPASAAGGGGLEPYYQKFTSSGTFTLPAGYGAGKPLLVNIQVIGGGGGGGGSRSNAFTINDTSSFRTSRIEYFGEGTQYNSNTIAAVGAIDAADNVNTQSLNAGGSGGIAQTQMYLTSNLTITVGAAGARPGFFTQNTPSDFTLFWRRDADYNSGGNNATRTSYVAPAAVGITGGTGGTSTAGAVSATGGTGGSVSASGYLTASINNFTIGANGWTPNVASAPAYVRTFNANSHGSAGSPAGTGGTATPLLGALAGGASGTTPVYGAFGVGGIKTDGDTHTGVEGTGGGYASIGASGAVILTWWE